MSIIPSNSATTPIREVPQGTFSNPPVNPLDSKISSVARTALDETHISKNSHNRIWTVLRALCFPLAWLVEKIVDVVKAIIDFINESSTPLPPVNPPTPTPTPTTTPNSPAATPNTDPNPNPAITGDIPVPPSPKGASNPPSPNPKDMKVRKLHEDIHKHIIQITEIHDLKAAVRKNIDSLKKKPETGKPAPQMSFGEFLDTLQKINIAVNIFKDFSKSIDSNLKQYSDEMEEITKKLPEGMSEEVTKALKDDGELLKDQKKESDNEKKSLNELITEWESILSSNKDSICTTFKNFQKKIIEKFQELKKIEKGGSIQDNQNQSLIHYENYQNHAQFLLELGWLSKEDVEHKAILTERPNMSDAIGFKNIGNTCWMNSTLQALRGIPEVSNRIKTLAAPRRIQKETAQENAERIKSVPPLAPRRVQQETDVGFEERLKDFENNYPFPRSDELEQQLHQARMGIYDRLASKNGIVAPQVRKAETEAEFKERLKKYGIIDLLAGWKSKNFTERDIKNSQKNTEAQYFRTKGIKNNKLEPLKPETDDEYAVRQAAHNAKIMIMQDSDDEIAKKQEVLNALKAVWAAWENDESKLEDALRSFRDAIFNGIKAAYNDETRGDQNDSIPLAELIMEVLGFTTGIRAVRNSKAPDASSSEVKPFFSWGIPLLGIAKGSHDVNELIQLSALERLNTDKKYPWEKNGHKIVDYTDTYSIVTDPQPVMSLIFERKFNDQEQNEENEKFKAEQEKLKAFDLHNEPEFAALIAKLQIKTGRPIDMRAIERAIKSKLSPPSPPATNQHAVNFPKDGILDLTAIFDPAVVARNGGSIKYRLKGITRHSGSDGSGHYVGYRPDANGQWRYYSDNTVRTKDSAEMQEESSKACVVFLEKV